MEYPFEHKGHKVYPNTFLENTSVSMFAPDGKCSYDETFDQRFATAIERDFQIQPDSQKFKESGILCVEDDEHIVSYLFYPNQARLRVGRKKYISFNESVVPMLVPMKNFIFNVMEYKAVEKMLVRKLNVFPIKGDSDDEIIENLETAYNFMFKDDLIKQAKDVAIPETAPWILSLRRAKLGDDESEMTVRIAVSKAKTEKMYNVILDTSVKQRDAGEIEEGAVDRKLRDLNDKLYDAFLWSVNDDIVALMEGEVKK